MQQLNVDGNLMQFLGRGHGSLHHNVFIILVTVDRQMLLGTAWFYTTQDFIIININTSHVHTKLKIFQAWEM